MNPLYGALLALCVPVRVTRVVVIAHRYTYAPPRCKTSQYRRTCILLSVSLWNNLGDPVFDGVGLACFKNRANAFLYWASCLLPFRLQLISLSLLSVYGLVLWGWGLRTNGVLIALSLSLARQPFLIIIISLLNFDSVIIYTLIYTLSGRTGSAGVAFPWTRVRIPVQQVLRFVDRVNTVQYVELRGYCP